MSAKDKLKKYFYVYYSYEPWGRGYIGKRECWCKPEEDTDYLGSFTDKTFRPTEKIIIQTFNSQSKAYEAEVKLHEYYQVDINSHFANKIKQPKSKKDFYNNYVNSIKIEDNKFKGIFIESVNNSKTIKEVLNQLRQNGFNCSYKSIRNWIKYLELDISHFQSNCFYNMNRYGLIDNKQLIAVVSKSNSLSEVLRKLGMKLGGGNFLAVKQKINEYNINTSHFNKKANQLVVKLSEEQLDKSHYKYYYTIIHPNGEKIITKSLKSYCDENNLNRGNMWSLCVGKLKYYKGYTITRTPIFNSYEIK